MSITPYFSSIADLIKKEIGKAEKKISAAVCWFTNEDIMNLLLNKLQQGVIVEMVILDDYINRNPYGCDFQRFISLGGELYLSQVDKPMHNKYCIIDESKLITGSYNWTYFAESRNQENVVFIEGYPDVIAGYLTDINRLKSITKKADVFSKLEGLDFILTKTGDLERSTYGTINVLSQEFFSKALLENKRSYYDLAKRIVPDNVEFQQKAMEKSWERPIVLRSRILEGIKNDGISEIFKKGSVLPAEFSKNFVSTQDNQENVVINIYHGDKIPASKNTLLKKYIINGIPPLAKGVATLNTDYKLTLDGKLHIIKHIHNTGVSDRQVIDLLPYNILYQD